MPVAVLSVVGVIVYCIYSILYNCLLLSYLRAYTPQAFRTGKSFLLNFILRFLRHATYGDLSQDWIVADGDELSEGNGNQMAVPENSSEAASAEGCRGRSFIWKAGQQRQTTGIWMWSEPFYKDCSQTGQKMAVLLMDTQGMFDNETTMTLTAQIFGLRYNWRL